MVLTSTGENVPYYGSCRVAIALCSMVGYAFFYLLRIDLSMAIVCMVKTPGGGNSSLGDGDAAWGNSSGLPPGQCGGEAGEAGSGGASGPGYEAEFEWSKQLQGWILSSFFYGYIVTQLPGSAAALRLGGKRVYGAAMAASMACTLLVPAGARLSPYVLIALRVLQGLAMGTCFPASHHLWGRWAPPLERSKLVAFSYAGTMVGTVLALGVSGFICATGVDGGWPLIFYIYGGCTSLWLAWWWYAVYDTPAHHPRISPAEKQYIMETVGGAVYSKVGSRPPWGSMLRSPPVWAIVVAHVCNNWGSYTILSCIPMYMKEVLQFDIKANGMLSAVPYVSMYVTTVCWSELTDRVRAAGPRLSTTVVRKVNQAIATLVPAVFIVLTGYMDCEQRYVAVALLTIAVTATSAGRAGYSVNHIDIAPKYSGVLFAISNTAATVPGMVAPYVAAALTPNGTQREWQTVFYICACVYTFSAIFYGVFASGEQQPWAGEAAAGGGGGAVVEVDVPLKHGGAVVAPGGGVGGEGSGDSGAGEKMVPA